MTSDEMIGHKFGSLEVLSVLRSTNGQTRIKCQCDCGNTCTPHASNVRRGYTRTCGCRNGQCQYQTHGGSKLPEYDIWREMKQRCLNPNNANYALYGGRGIQIDPRWIKSFRAFIQDVRRRPTKGHSLERRDNHGHYEPGNIYWATQSQQARNRRNNRQITAFGITRLLCEWSEHAGISENAIRARIDRLGWSTEDAVTKPLYPRRK